MASFLFRVLLANLLALIFVPLAFAANTTIIQPESPERSAIILVEGDFLVNDDKAFTKIALQIEHAVVVFSSNGGILSAGLGIGKAIRLRQYNTFVMKDTTCASACAIAWLGGIHRFMEANAKIGFHAAYTDNNGKLEESGVANALVGSYLNQIGLPENAIAYITHAQPESMQWLSVDEARNAGIQVEASESNSAPSVVQPSTGQSEITSDYKIAVGVDLFGFDLPGMPLHYMNWATCSQSCATNSSCRAFTFNSKSKTCFLKEGANLAVLYAPASSGFSEDLASSIKQSQLNIIQRTDVVGSDYRNMSGTNMEACLRACEVDQACRAFTFIPKKSQCWLKSSASKTQKKIGVVSGIK